MLNFSKAITCSLDNKKKPHPNSNPLETGQKERANVKIIPSLNDHKRYLLYPFSKCLMLSLEELVEERWATAIGHLSKAVMSHCSYAWTTTLILCYLIGINLFRSEMPGLLGKQIVPGERTLCNCHSVSTHRVSIVLYGWKGFIIVVGYFNHHSSVKFLSCFVRFSLNIFAFHGW